MATENKHFPVPDWLPVLVLAAIVLCPAVNAAAQDGRGEPRPEGEKAEGEQVVLSASELKQDPRARGVAPEQLGPESIDPMIDRELEPDATGCQLPPLVLEVFDPASQRAVVRVENKPPRVLKPGEAIAETSVVVRLVREDLLVAVGPAGDGGKRPMLWIHPPEAPGGRSRVQCFMPGVAGR